MKLVKEYINDDNYYIELLNESLNEELNIDTIKNIINNISDKVEAASRLIKKFNESRNLHACKYIASILIVMFLANFAGRNNRWNNLIHASQTENVQSRVDKLAISLAKQSTISVNKIKTEIKGLQLAKEIKPELIKSKFINLNNVHASDSVKNFIKHHEKLNLTAYKDQDMISIGWGHAEYPKTTKYKPGKSTITIEKANQLFLKDIKEAENGVIRIIKSWKNPKIEISLTQGMFDAMVSMAYNMGITGLKNTIFMDLVEKGKFKEAAQRIKVTKILSTVIKNEKKVYIEMPGLKNRRLEEYKLFASK